MIKFCIILSRQNKVYVTNTTNGKCVELDYIPGMPIVYIAKQLISKVPEDAKLLKSDVADSKLKANLYGGVMEKYGHKGILSRKSSATFCLYTLQGSSIKIHPLALT